MEIVRCVTRDGLRLDGLLYPATGKSRLAFDAVVMHHSVGGSFYAPDFYEDAIESLTGRGVTVIRANNRGHDIVNRHAAADGSFYYVGAAFEKIDDCRADFRAWNDLAAARGARRVALWGHSLGAVKSIYYAGTERDARVVAVVASSPPRFNHAQYQTDPVEGPAMRRQLDEARALVAEGRGNTLLNVTRPASLLIAAAAYVDKYGTDDGYDYVRFIPGMTVPVLLTLGGAEGIESIPGSVRVALYGADEYLRRLSAQHKHMDYALIDGADHWYRGHERLLTDTVVRFFDSVR